LPRPPVPPQPAEVADHLYAREALQSSPRGRVRERPEPYTLQWFLDIEGQRHGRQGRWLPRLLEFAKHSGETLLGLGDGLGTAWHPPATAPTWWWAAPPPTNFPWSGVTSSCAA